MPCPLLIVVDMSVDNDSRHFDLLPFCPFVWDHQKHVCHQFSSSYYQELFDILHCLDQVSMQFQVVSCFREASSFHNKRLIDSSATLRLCQSCHQEGFVPLQNPCF